MKDFAQHFVGQINAYHVEEDQIKIIIRKAGFRQVLESYPFKRSDMLSSGCKSRGFAVIIICCPSNVTGMTICFLKNFSGTLLSIFGSTIWSVILSINGTIGNIAFYNNEKIRTKTSFVATNYNIRIIN